MKILLLGADGYIGREFMGYQTHHEVIPMDSFYKRRLMQSLNIKPLFESLPVEGIIDRDMTDALLLTELIIREQPDVVIHLAEQPSAPYSMRGYPQAKATIWNNLQGTMNLVYAIRDHSPHTHIVKLGTMGEYGCPNVDIPEGWFDLEYNGRTDRLLFPKTPHSIYHLSKVFDSDLLAFACRMWGLKVTDLNQGFVYGTNGFSRFSYDAEFGTVLNRFIVQAVVGIPLTVYGEGGQTRGMIHIDDTIQCLLLAAENPPDEGEFRVVNQLSEWKSINDLAQIVSRVTGAEINHINNPRVEKESHYYNVEHKRLDEYGFNPLLLCDEMIDDMVDIVKEYKDEINTDQISPKVKWRCS